MFLIKKRKLNYFKKMIEKNNATSSVSNSFYKPILQRLLYNLDTETIEENRNEERIIQVCRDNKIKFTDPTFPPNLNSLLKRDSGSETLLWENVFWMRISDLFQFYEFELFKELSPLNLNQGLLSNGYFVEALSILIETPELIKNLFSSSHPSEYGVYAINLFINGKWSRILIDDHIPVIEAKDGGVKPAFSSSVISGEAWVLLLEKAYAKAYGSYQRINSGDPIHFLRELTGAPYARITPIISQAAFLQKISGVINKGWILTAKSANSTLEIQEGMTYTILSIDRENKEISLRNPWSPALKNQDGIFSLKFYEFAKNFTEIGVCMVQPKFKSFGIVIDQSEIQKSLVMMEIKENLEITVSLDQFDLRSRKEFSYDYFRLSMCRISDEELQFIDCILSDAKTLFISETLPQGKYLILIEGFWRQKPNKCTLNIYTSSRPKLTLLQLTHNIFKLIEYLMWKNFTENNQEVFTKIDKKEIFSKKIDKIAFLEKFSFFLIF